ncbi:MAG: hypothetical protein ABW024_06955 [Microbacterium sp.]
MTSTPIPPIVPDPLDPELDSASIEREDGEHVIDPDVDEDLVVSADADRLAAGGDAD